MSQSESQTRTRSSFCIYLVLLLTADQNIAQILRVFWELIRAREDTRALYIQQRKDMRDVRQALGLPVEEEIEEAGATADEERRRAFASAKSWEGAPSPSLFPPSRGPVVMFLDLVLCVE